ncbi:hypothetical protein BDZ90DRAFT_98709 [Jaminaea rosea]|uniref:Uncharacterized protein n=1 Tax=Jaminaea rosea TaxID=1569628 RepID=A0A316UH65_9BASI|nr:hypothetical protein BDZ90DRAFT_98709 [Jaminaea rosea]PWN24530.1 hypothetical protein BDZ90DRAFT_98709 [Jaminaea rosea]
MRDSMSAEQPQEDIGSSLREKAASQEDMANLGAGKQEASRKAYQGGSRLPIDDDDDVDKEEDEAAASPWPKSISEHGESVRNSIEEFQAEWVQGSSQQDRVAGKTGKDYEGDVDEEERERRKKRVRRDVNSEGGSGR